MTSIPAFAGIAAIRDLLKLGRFEDANLACDQGLKEQPSNFALLTLKGYSLRGMGDQSGGLKALRSALRISPTYAPALQAAAQIEFEARDPRARATLEAIVRIEPSNAVAHDMLGELAFEAHDCNRALTHLVKVKQRPLVRWQKAVCHFTLEHWNEAAQDFELLLKLREHAPTRFNLALSYWRGGSANNTLRALGTLNDADSLSLRAAALMASKEVSKALEVLQAAVRQYPRDERILQELALLCLDQNAIQLGVSVLEAGVQNNPTSVRLLTALGVFLVRLGQTDKGEAHFAAARLLAPTSGLGEVATASTMMQMGLAGEAVRVLRGLPAEEPMVALTLARALLSNLPSPADMAEARRLLSSVITRDPSNVPARTLLGKTLAQSGEIQSALSHLEAALKIEPSHGATIYQLMTIYKKQGRSADASRMAAKMRQVLAREKADEIQSQDYQLSLAPVQP